MPTRAQRDFPGRGLRETVWTVAPDQSATDAYVTADEESQTWVARWTFAMQGDRLVVRSVMLTPKGAATPPGGVTSALLRELSPTWVVGEATEGLRERDVPGTFAALSLRWRREAVTEVATSGPPSKRRGGRPRLPDDLIREVALRYLDEQHRPGVLRRLAERFGTEQATVRDWVHVARGRGYLVGGQRGRAGAMSGPLLTGEGQEISPAG